MSNNSGTRVQIFVAVVGAVGALGAPLLANWNQFFGQPTVEAPIQATLKTPESPTVAVLRDVAPPTVMHDVDPQDTGNFHVVTISTKSLQEARAASDSLRARGYPSQVILSSTGYYGVTLGNYSKERAKSVLAGALGSGAVPSDSFVLPRERYRKTVYP